MKRILYAVVILCTVLGIVQAAHGADPRDVQRLKQTGDRKSTRLNSSHRNTSRMPSSA